MKTHEVFNQATALVDYNMFESDAVLNAMVSLYGADWARNRLVDFGRFAGSAQAQEWATQSNTSEPELHTFDRFGHRVDRVDFHPSYHSLMSASIGAGLHSMPWSDPRPGAHVARAALFYLSFQNEQGHGCPISMTYSVVASLRKEPTLAGEWLPRLISTNYDPRFIPAAQKAGVTMGMGMTEKQGGSDVRANTTRAVPVGDRGPGKEYRITGHKWFTSAPMSDAFLVLAKTEAGVSCFLVPRFRPDGSQNALFIQRLKDKLGNRSNASSELEFVDTSGWLVGEEGRGVATIIEMVNHTRLDCSIGSAALMRQATMQAIHHASKRATFGKLLIDHPLMRNVLADLALESEAATAMMMRVAHAYDGTDRESALFKRIASAVSKYWTCKRSPVLIHEALECFGGNGYVEESPMPRLYREAPLLGIWEGSGNVICLDVLRATNKEPESLEVFVNELELARGHSRRLDSFLNGTKREVAALAKVAGKGKRAAQVALTRELNARRTTERLALALQASLLTRHAPDYVADAFVASRLGNQGGYAFGTLPAGTNVSAILERAYTLR